MNHSASSASRLLPLLALGVAALFYGSSVASATSPALPKPSTTTTTQAPTHPVQAPVILTAAASKSMITLTWAPAASTPTAVTGYVVSLTSMAKTPYATYSSLSSSARSATFSGLSPATSYTIIVNATYLTTTHQMASVASISRMVTTSR